MARRGEVRRGLARIKLIVILSVTHGVARWGKVGQGAVWHGKDFGRSLNYHSYSHGRAWHGMARSGPAWHGFNKEKGLLKRMRKIRWSIKELKEILDERQKNQFDANIAVSGARGNGKSSLIGKLFYRFPHFDSWKHQVYDREAVITLLQEQKFGLCWDDEAINTGYKRDFQNKGQQDLIKNITVHRDNFNIFASAIPNFFSLDKDLRDLYFIHLHVIERGVAVVHMPSQGRLYSPDKWDAEFNKKIEAKWASATKNNVNFKPPYHKLSTFRGYLYFNDMTPSQRKLYEKVKETKRAKAFKTTQEDTGDVKAPFLDRLFKLLKEGNLSNDGLLQACLLEDKKYSNVTKQLNGMIKDAGMRGTLRDWLSDNSSNGFHSNVKGGKPDLPSY